MTRTLNFAFFGSSLLSAYWNGAATYYRGIIRALNALGHNITFYEPDVFGRQEHRDIEEPTWAKVVVYPARDESGVWRALDSARNADLLVKTSGVGAFDALLETAILDIRSPSSLAIFWDVDAPATLDRIQRNPEDPFRALVPHYDLVLTYGGGEPVIKAYTEFGARECIPIYNALDPETHYPSRRDSRFEADLALLANRLPDREARIDDFFLRPAAKLPFKQFLLGGSGWKGKDMARNVKYVGHVYTHEHNAFNCTPQAVLNVNRESMAHYGYSPPTRIFEAAGAGACLITDQWEGIEMFLEPGKEVLVAKDGDEVAEHLLSLTSEQARAIGIAARQRILAEHTYAKRAVQLQTILMGNKRPVSTQGFSAFAAEV